MALRHEAELELRLERVFDVGCAEIRHGELLMWFGQDRLTVGIWREIDDRWNELLARTHHPFVPLLAGEADGVIVFVWGDGLEARDGSWLKTVHGLTRRMEPFKFDEQEAE